MNTEDERPPLEHPLAAFEREMKCKKLLAAAQQREGKMRAVVQQFVDYLEFGENHLIWPNELWEIQKQGVSALTDQPSDLCVVRREDLQDLFKEWTNCGCEDCVALEGRIEAALKKPKP